MSTPILTSPVSSIHPPVADLDDFIQQAEAYFSSQKQKQREKNENQHDQPILQHTDPTTLPQQVSPPTQDVTIAGHELTFRILQRDDNQNGYISLLGQLTKVNEDCELFKQQFDSLNSDYIIVVAVLKETNTIVGTGTLLLERKFIRNYGIVGHIEDVVVSSQVRRCGIGLTIIQTLSSLGSRLGCYKTILDCSPDNEPFYLSCGFENKGLQMGKYY